MWNRKPLKEVAYTAGRIGWKGLTAKEYVAEGPYFLSVHSLNYGDFVDFRDAFNITQARYDESPEIAVEANDILICKDGAGIGKVGIVKDVEAPTTINSSLLLIRSLSEIYPKFLYHYLQSPFFQKIVQERIEGATTPHLYQREIKEFPVPIPELSEQQRIVAILDQAFADIEKARANAEKNLKNARELFDSYLNAICTKTSLLPPRRIGDVCSLYQGIAINKKTKHLLVERSSLPLLRIKDLKNNSEEQYVAEEGYPKNSRVYEDDILYTRTGSLGLVFKGRNGVLHNNSFKVEPNELIDKGYLFWWLQHVTFKSMIMQLALKAAQPDITHSIFKVQTIEIPSLSYQKDAVTNIEIYKIKTDELIAKYQRKLLVLDELKKSLLQKAFSGELTKTEGMVA
jgi:type I restriction enzyme, S subunit